MKNYIFILLMIIFTCLNGQDLSDFEKYKAQQNDQISAYDKEFNDFQGYQDEQFIKYKKFIEEKWGSFKESTPKTWVSYADNMDSRASVDFESDKVDIEVVVDPKTTEKEIKEKLEKLAGKVLKEKDETGKAILEGQVANPKNPEQAIEDKDIKGIVEESKLITKKVGGKTIYKISLELVPNSDKKRIAKYKEYIEKFCKKAGVETALALAIIKTESNFNPRAYNRSGNAYGMMQIVPEYAGKTMNKKLYNDDRKPSSKVLFNPQKNLEMGIGYLAHLQDNSWKKVKNKTNKRYCVICSYNGGRGAVFIALAGQTKKIPQDKWDKMFALLNSRDNKKVFNLLSTKSWDETQHYIKTVEKRYTAFKQMK